MSPTPPTVAVLTRIPSPYQVELLDEVARRGEVVPRAVYVLRASSQRQWAATTPAHMSVCLADGPDASRRAEEWVRSADLFVAAWYADRPARELIAVRAETGKPWCYWGERPGFSGRPLLSRLRRWWLLRPLRRSLAPVWGIGSWAVEAWRREFGGRRSYHNLPYFSELGRFTPPADRTGSRDGGVRFLFSGSLIPRKGVDLLAGAFSEVAAIRPHTRLEFVGAGELEPTLRERLAVFGDRVRFTGFCQWADLPAAYHRADVLVAPSRHDGWGLIVPEGLAAGLPVIGTDRTGSALDLIRPGVNGWRVPAGDGAALARALAEAADLPGDRLREMSAAALASVAGHTLADGAKRFADLARHATAWS